MDIELYIAGYGSGETGTNGYTMCVKTDDRAIATTVLPNGDRKHFTFDQYEGWSFERWNGQCGAEQVGQFPEPTKLLIE